MKSVGYINNQKQSFCLILLYLIASAGIIAGAVYQTIKQTDPSAWIHQYFAPVFTKADVSECVIRGFVITAIFLITAFLGGFFALGQPLAIFLLFSRSFAIGVSGAEMYISQGGRAVPEMLVFVMPMAVTALIVYSLAVRESIMASTYTLSVWIPEGFMEKDRSDIKLYCIKFAVLIIISLIISATVAIINYLFVSR